MFRRIPKYLKKLRNLSYINNVSCRYKDEQRRLTVSAVTQPKTHSCFDALQKFKVGNQISGFQVSEISEISELQLIAVRLQHIKTGADYFHIARDDANNTFCIGFRTTPMDSTGSPHILEHIVLCGSKNFPCRDPFFKMLNRSLSTFMNAMTGSDYTIYPFSTQNPVDFKNLMAVYLDAVFNPTLSKLDFLQEGWRLEHENLVNKNSPIVFKGVVFNEMKGVFADSQQLFAQKLQNGILPSHTYGHISGGDPLCIPELTWENLKKFHEDHYHPSNCRIFSYGNFPLEDHLTFIDSAYLSKFDKIDPDTYVPEEPRWTNPKEAHVPCNADPMMSSHNQTSLGVSYLLTSITNDFENFVLSIISELLLGGPNAPFYKSLIETGFGTSFSSVAGYDNHTRTTTFTIGLQGMSSDVTDEVKNAIDNTLDLVIKEGFPSERIESILHNIELSLKHQTTNFGLGLAINLSSLWNHDGNLINALKINSKIDKFRGILSENPRFLQEKIEQYFKNNSHKYTLSMSPSEGYEQNLIEAEKKLLQAKTSQLSSQDKESVWETAHILQAKQEEKEDISCLPTLHVSDISREISATPLNNLNICGGTPLQLCIQPTNGVTYFNAILGTGHVPEDLMKYVPLFCGILTSMGAGNFDFRELNQKIELVSGGLSSTLHISPNPENVSMYEEGIYLSSYCLNKNFGTMLDLWCKILNDIRLEDVSHFTTLVKMISTEKSNNLIHNGHSYAMKGAASSLDYVASRKERAEGLTYLQYLKELSELEDMTEILSKMKNVADHLLNRNRIRIAVNTSNDNVDESVQITEKFLQLTRGTNVKEDPMMSVPSGFSPCTKRTHHEFSFPVNYSAKSFSSIPYTHPDSGILRLLARLMFQFLHREIREKGGAYGGGAVASPGSPFCFFSYRDPHSVQTLKTFDDAVNWVISGAFSQQDIDEAKLGVFQSVDAPVSPGSKGLRQFLHHISDDMYRYHRLSILDVQKDDIIRVCRIHLKESSCEGTCLIGPQNSNITEIGQWERICHN